MNYFIYALLFDS